MRIPILSWLKTTLRDTRRDGSFETFYKNGRLNSRETRRNGERNGSFESYFENGQVEAKGQFKDGAEEGPWEKFHDNGELKFKGPIEKENWMVCSAGCTEMARCEKDRSTKTGGIMVFGRPATRTVS